jgi:hypothetical protein
MESGSRGRSGDPCVWIFVWPHDESEHADQDIRVEAAIVQLLGPFAFA